MNEKLDPIYNNAYWDIYDILQDLRRQIGFNVVISIVQNDDQLTMGFHFKAIPHMEDVKPYEVKFDVPEDFKEPTANLSQVIVDHVKSYIASGGTGDSVEPSSMKNQA